MCQSTKGSTCTGVLGCTCGCCGGGPSFRRFFSSKEERECLETYRDQIKKELVGVEEQINKRKGK